MQPPDVQSLVLPSGLRPYTPPQLVLLGTVDSWTATNTAHVSVE